jgi:hypothetical protein
MVPRQKAIYKVEFCISREQADGKRHYAALFDNAILYKITA